MMRPWRRAGIVGCLGLLLLLLGWVGAEGATSFEDNALVLMGSNWNDETHGWVDAIPAEDSVFELYRADIDTASGLLLLDIFTNYHGGEEVVCGTLTAYAADLFIDVGLDGVFDYAVAMSEHGFDGNLVATTPGELYDIRGSLLMSSSDYVEGHAVRTYYGESWDNPWDGSPDAVPVPVCFAEGNLVGSGTNGFSWSALGSPGDPDHRISLSLALSDLGLDGEGSFGLLVGPATCANDIMTVQATTAPEPTTMFLVGAGLIGLAGLTRKYKGGDKVKRDLGV